MENQALIITTGNEVAGTEIVQYLGVVRGIVVRVTGIGAGFIGGLKSIAGGNIEEFTHVCENAGQEAFSGMARHAHQINADAIIGMRYDATEFSQGSTEVLAYGTAGETEKQKLIFKVFDNLWREFPDRFRLDYF